VSPDEKALAIARAAFRTGEELNLAVVLKMREQK